jgi:hypothetical protein
VKDPKKLQEKLRKILRAHTLKILVVDRPWNDLELRETVWTVEAYLRKQNDVVDDPLKEWVEECKFYYATTFH